MCIKVGSCIVSNLDTNSIKWIFLHLRQKHETPGENKPKKLKVLCLFLLLRMTSLFCSLVLFSHGNHKSSSQGTSWGNMSEQSTVNQDKKITRYDWRILLLQGRRQKTSGKKTPVLQWLQLHPKILAKSEFHSWLCFKHSEIRVIKIMKRKVKGGKIQLFSQPSIVQNLGHEMDFKVSLSIELYGVLCQVIACKLWKDFNNSTLIHRQNGRIKRKVHGGFLISVFLQ